MFQQDEFGLFEHLHAFTWIRFRRCTLNQAVVFRIAPTGLIVGTVGHEHIEKRVGIGVVGIPASTRYLILQLMLSFEIAAPFQAAQFHANAKIAFPIVLNYFRHGLMRFVRVVQNFDFRKVMPLGITGLGQKFTGGIHVERSALRGLISG